MVFDTVDWTKYRWLMYVVGVILIVLVILMLAGVGLESLGATGKTAPEEKVFWKSYDPLVPLRITGKETSPNLRFDRYTVVIDMIWLNTRVTDVSDVYRHIFHRGSGEGADYLGVLADIRQSTTNGSATGPTRTDMLQRMPQGLPIRMNPGIMADPVKNDMIVFIDTEKDNEVYRESVRIPDIPMNQPFRLAIVVLPTLVEVYVNCGLEVTKLLEGTPRAIESNWYGLVGPASLNAVVQNLRIFTGPLGGSQLRGYCAKLPEFEQGLSGCDQKQIEAQGYAQTTDALSA